MAVLPFDITAISNFLLKTTLCFGEEGMSKKNNKVENKAKYIVSLTLFSLLIIICIYGLFRKISDGDEIADIMVNVGVILFSLFWVVKDILALSGHPFKIIRFPIKILSDIGAAVFILCSGIAYFYILIHFLIDGSYLYALFFAFLLVGAVFGVHLFVKMVRLHIAAYSATSQLKKTNSIDKEKRMKLIKQLISSDSLQIIVDITCRNVPYIDESGIVSVYDEKNTANKACVSISKNNKLSPYYQEFTITKKDDFFQRCYDIGFETFNFITEFGEVNLRFDELEIQKNDDPIHSLGTSFRIQHLVAKQYRQRYAHMIEKRVNQLECESVLNKASIYADLEVKEFISGLFYVYTVPKTAYNSDSVIKFSNHANLICQKNKIDLEKYKCQNGKGILFLNENDNLIPYSYTSKTTHILAFSKYSFAEKTMEDFLLKLTEIDEKLKTESEIPEDERIYILRLRNHFREITECEINIMSGAELADYLTENNMNSIIINDREEITSDTLHSYNVKV